MNVLITGGLGFIGQHLTQAMLQLGHGVTVLDNLDSQVHSNTPKKPSTDSRLRVIHGDVTDQKALSSALESASHVIHLAALTGTGQSMQQIGNYTRVNTLGTALLMQALFEQKHSVQKVLLASTRAVYGEGEYLCQAHGRLTPKPRTPKDLALGLWEPKCPTCGAKITPLPTLESAQVCPASVYAATKAAQEDLVRLGCTALGIPYSIARLQNVYGTGQSLHNPYTGILSIFAKQIMLQQPVNVYEDGQENRDFVHVSDVVKALSLLMAVGIGDDAVFNVGTGQAQTVFDVAVKLHHILQGSANSFPRISGQYRLGDVRHAFADTNKLQQLGWSPTTSFEQGLTTFCAWVSKEG
jgi:dTDP-L-rhamnose 4-epimerase